MVSNKEKEIDIMGAYDAIAPLYKEYSQNKEAYLNAVDELVVKHLSSDSRLLDVGSGDGRRLKKIKETVGLKEAIAIEPSSEMARICRDSVGVPVHEVFAEDIDKLDLGTFDVVTALWNVFGHIPNREARLKSLQNIKNALKEDGVVILDVNNRHNALAYGKLKVVFRVLMDTINFQESRGDAIYDWKIGNKVFKSRGHLFTPKEIEALFREVGFKVISRFSLNYSTGEISTSKYKGQLFYILKK